MSEKENYRRWNDATRGAHETWYITWNDPATNQGFWLRHLTKQPPDGDHARGELWFARFDPQNPARTFGIHKHVPWSSVASGEKPFVLSVGGARLGHDHAVGQLSGDGHDIRWDLRWEPAADALRVYPDLMYMKEGIAPTTPMMPNWHVPLSGSLVIDGETIRLDRVPAGQTHLWGKRHGYEWTWAHCVDFLGAPDASLEIIGGKIKRKNFTSPNLLVVALDVDGERYRFNQVRHWVTNRVSWETSRVQFTARSATAKLVGELTCPPERMLNCPYVDPDGSNLWCRNTEIGDAKLTLYRRSGLGWREYRTLSSTGRAHFEIGGRTRDPAVTREHILVR